MFIDDGTANHIRHLVTSDTEDGYIGTIRALRHNTPKMTRPEWFEDIDIEEHLTQMYNRELTKSNHIGEIRQALSYQCEDNIKALDYIFSQARKGYVWDSAEKLFADLMKNAFQGKVNPKTLELLVTEVFSAGKEYKQKAI